MIIPSPIRRMLNLTESAIFAPLRWLLTELARDITLPTGSGSIMVLAPHPDDETLGCGATILRARTLGLRVRVIVITDGRHSNESAKIPPQKLAAMRREECLEACGELGVGMDDVIFLNYIDGQNELHQADIAMTLLHHISDFAPSLILSPIGIDRHPDHRAVAAVIDLLVKNNSVSCPVYEYPIWFWTLKAWLRTNCSLTTLCTLLRPRRVAIGPYHQQKRAALRAHRTQLENITNERTWSTLTPGFVAQFFGSHELFFEKSLPPHWK